MAEGLVKSYSRNKGTLNWDLKVSLYKAFDSLHWDFIALGVMIFFIKFINWIWDCISAPRFSIKVNGALNGFLKRARCLIQGDTMLAYLFSLYMDVFSSMIDKVPNAHFQFYWKCKDLKLNHHLFADDVLLFLELVMILNGYKEHD
ncbi:uncharacterized protein LOC141699923 [Apium graveolens]|uniref:uncharacterized protein LOC141699923 n=1 Tax=Apium graveolens TaxID=4045 RepID=UPI003D79B8BF